MYSKSWSSLAQPVRRWWQPEQRPPPDAEVTTATDDDATKETQPSVSSNETRRDYVAMLPPPLPPTIQVPSETENGTEGAEEEATTPKAGPVVTQNGAAVPSLFLSSPGEDDDDDDDEDEDDDDGEEKMPPPTFPSLFSAQRAGTSADPSRATPIPSPASFTNGSMAPPPRPQPRGPTGMAASASPVAALHAARRPAHLPIPHRGPPLRNPTASGTSLSLSSSLAPPPSSVTKPNKPTRKVILEPGHSPLDWARVTADPAGNRLRGSLPADAPYLLRVTPSQLKQMNGRKGRDAWTALGGMVYNITPYVPFHPGGKGELLRCAGKDGNKLFNDVHSWVNYDNMLSACRVGIMVEEHASTSSPMEEMD
ncbi:hypothetical protein SEPCBS57363_004947 [Sporothrix epigloea]|uniref:Cytochrome b5 heme-binding domain-containing protein n=1 Tax=Sporothrix epigloea TaxID=1892477 RepID=A0ABP0DUV5_9PEZI